MKEKGDIKGHEEKNQVKNDNYQETVAAPREMNGLVLSPPIWGKSQTIPCKNIVFFEPWALREN